MALINIIVRSSFLRMLNFGLTAVVSFLLMPFVIHHLGNRMYGLWVLVGTFLSYYGLLDLGISSATQRFVSQGIGKKDIAEINLVINTSLVLFSLIGLVVVVISAVLAALIPCFVKDASEIGLFRSVILIMGGTIGISFPLRVFRGILSAHMRHDLLTVISTAVFLVRAALIVLFLQKGFGVLALALISSGASLAEYSFMLALSKKVFPQLALKPSLFRKSMVRKLFGYSIYAFIGRIADYLRFRVDDFVIGAFVGLSAITVYAVAIRLMDYFTQFIVSAVGFMSPLFSQYEGAGDAEAIRQRFLDVTRISVVLAVFIGSSLLFYGQAFIERWVGPEFKDSYYVLAILCIPITIALMQNPSIGVLYGISKHKYYMLANSCEGILNLVLSLLLVKPYGIYGVALGTAIPMLIFKLIIQPVYVCRCIKLRSYVYHRIIATSTLKTILPLTFYFSLVDRYVSPSYMSLFCIGLFQIVMFIPAAFFIFDADQRQMLKNGLKFSKFLKRT